MSLLAGLLDRSRRRLKSIRPARAFWNVLVVSLWLLDAVVVFYAVENWRGAQRFADVKNRLEQRGVKLDWKTFAPSPIPDEQNAAMHPLLRPLCQYEQTRTPHPEGGWTTTTRWLDSNGLRRVENVSLPTGWRDNGKYFDAETNSLQPPIDLARWQTCFRHDTNFPSPAQPCAPAQDVLLGLAKFEPELGELHEALRRPHCRFPLHYDERPSDMLLRHQACLRNLGRVLKLRAVAQLAAGEAEKALADTQDIFTLADGLKNEPVMISFLVRVAILRIGCSAIGEGLARQTWSETQLVRLQALLAKQEVLPGLELAIKGETASALQTLDSVRADGGFVMYVHETENSNPHGCRQFVSLRWAPRGWFEQNKATIAEHMFQRTMPALAPAARRVYPPTVQAEVAGRESMRPTPYSLLAFLCLPYIDSAIRRAAYAQTVVDETLLACALERHRLGTGRFPECLAALYPDYLPTAPHDVVTGAPLRYRLSPDGGFLLWAAGWNEWDEEGLVSKTPRGAILIEEGDWVWERQAPL